MPFKTQSSSSPYKILKEPAKTQELWRYMDFAKFVSLIQRECLFFPSLIHLSKTDPWEGLPSPMNFRKETIASIPEVIYPKSSNSDKAYISPQLVYKQFTLEELHKGNIDSAINALKEQSLEQQCQFFVNCWHINNADRGAG